MENLSYMHINITVQMTHKLYQLWKNYDWSQRRHDICHISQYWSCCSLRVRRWGTLAKSMWRAFADAFVGSTRVNSNTEFRIIEVKPITLLLIQRYPYPHLMATSFYIQHYLVLSWIFLPIMNILFYRISIFIQKHLVILYAMRSINAFIREIRVDVSMVTCPVGCTWMRAGVRRRYTSRTKHPSNCGVALLGSPSLGCLKQKSVDSLWLSDAIWRYRSWSRLVVILTDYLRSTAWWLIHAYQYC